jgi:hypothetical protein
MNFLTDSSNEAFREEVRAFLCEHLPLDMAWRGQ